MDLAAIACPSGAMGTMLAAICRWKKPEKNRRNLLQLTFPGVIMHMIT